MTLKRCKRNPLIKPSDVNPSMDEFEVIGAFNPGATTFNGQVILLLRVAEKCKPVAGKVRIPVFRFETGTGIPQVLEFDEDDPDLSIKDTRGISYKGKKYLTSLSHIRLARSDDGINFVVEKEPFIFPCTKEEEYGIEDARITNIDGKYYINYTIVSSDGWCTFLSVTTDFKNIQKLGVIFHPQNKDIAIFPEKVNGKYIALHRPNNSGFGKPSIWYSESPDLLHWGQHKCILRPRDTNYESLKVGGGAPPIKTKDGWLCIYHAKGDNSKYSLFTLLLDLEHPWKVVKQGVHPILEPELEYETDGFFGNVVFSNGITEKDGKINIYYGAADESSCLALSTIEELLRSL